MILYVGNLNSSVAKRLTRIGHFCFSPDPKRRAYAPPSNPKILLDSGAFADVRGTRLTFEQALDRQLAYERKNGFIAERIVSYDLLIDEQMSADRQVKARWTEKAGWGAVETTLAAAEFLAARRSPLAPRQLVLSCQGVEDQQYIFCMTELLKMASEADCIGLGGWCIVGQQRHLIKLFWRTMDTVLPMVADKVKDVHIFGVSYVPLLREFALRCKALGLNASTDTSRFFFELSRGRVFDPQSGKSRHYRGAGNLAKDDAFALRNIETAYKFVQNIETWRPANSLF